MDGREVGAAVAVILSDEPLDSRVLLIERSARSEDPWSGQVAFPGGRREPSDASLIATAVRETREEVGLSLDPPTCLGAMGPWSPANRPSLLVAPLVFGLEGSPTVGRSSEVNESFWVSLKSLAATADRLTRNTSRGPLEFPCFRAANRVIWGFTYRVLAELISLLGLATSET